MNASDNFRNEPDNIRKFPRKTVSPKRPSTIQPPGSTQFQAQKQHVVCLAVLPSKIRSERTACVTISSEACHGGIEERHLSVLP
jgi:hypothetical protein